MKNLENSLLTARKFMEHDAMNKKSNGAPTQRNIQTESIPTQPQINQPQIPNVSSHSTPNMNPKANMNEEAIRNSRLPDAIKQAMIDTPIPDVSPTPNLSESFMDKVSKKMNSQEYSIEQMRNTANSNVNNNVNSRTNKVDIPTTHIRENKKNDPIPSPFETQSLDTNVLKETIKECIKEIMKEENLLMESKSIKENLQIRVGNKIFVGNIKSIKSIKK